MSPIEAEALEILYERFQANACSPLVHMRRIFDGPDFGLTGCPTGNLCSVDLGLTFLHEKSVLEERQ